MEDDKIEVVDLSPDNESDETVKDFLDEQMKRFDAMVAAVKASDMDDPAPAEELAAYVRGAAAAADEAIAAAWPELRDNGEFSSETFKKVTMTSALCGVMVHKAQLLARDPSDRDGIAIALMVSRLIQAAAAAPDGPSTAVTQAVTMRATADELLIRAKKAEEEGE